MSARDKITSFAVLDLETTGLPDYNFNKANITEISINGFAAKDICNTNTSEVPRISHKLNLIFNPLMMICPEAEKITGLNNYMLEDESSFNTNAANVIINFLKHLKQPVCLVAHNGDFDFRILKCALDKLQMHLPSNVVCVDSLAAFKELDKVAEENEQRLAQENEKRVAEKNEQTIAQENEHIGPLQENDFNSDNLAPITILDSEEKDNSIDWQKLNETTPKRPPNVLPAKRRHQRSIETEDEISPAKQKIKSCRSLFKSSNELTNIAKKVKSYKLANIYCRLFEKPPEVTHHAEADVEILKKVLFRYGKSFVEYAEANAQPFADVKKLGVR